MRRGSSIISSVSIGAYAGELMAEKVDYAAYVLFFKFHKVQHPDSDLSPSSLTQHEQVFLLDTLVSLGLTHRISRSEGALVSYTRALAAQLAHKSIRVNCVAPGPIWTPLHANTKNVPSEVLGERFLAFF